MKRGDSREGMCSLAISFAFSSFFFLLCFLPLFFCFCFFQLMMTRAFYDPSTMTTLGIGTD